MNEAESHLEFYRNAFGGSWITQGIWTAAELGIADLLVDGPRTAEELAAASGAHSGALYRLLRALASVGVFAQDADGRFALTPRGALLRSDVPGSQRSFAVMMGAEFYAAWGELLHSVRTGEPGFEKRFGAPFFRYLEEHPDRHRVYDAAMNGIHDVETEPMLDAYDFSTFDTVADIGGGNGLALTGILKRHSAVKGILFDLPAVAERARTVISGNGFAHRLRVVGGDFFVSVPPGADAYVLRHIVHDWQDPEAIAILARCREAAGPAGRILVVENVLPPGDEPSFGKWLDLMMLLVAGRERTEDEYRRLFSAAGLCLNRVIPTSAGVSILEAAAG
ncbi:MAG: methyltransferase [Candidatus Hydrogenedentes bacterium]|nr:methyltransferase [Candidatus Hydrogenedentota bacterium]